jgi:hypothetical protein
MSNLHVMEWESLETAPEDVEVIVWAVQGEASGPRKWEVGDKVLGCTRLGQESYDDPTFWYTGTIVAFESEITKIDTVCGKKKWAVYTKTLCSPDGEVPPAPRLLEPRFAIKKTFPAVGAEITASDERANPEKWKGTYEGPYSEDPGKRGRIKRELTGMSLWVWNDTIKVVKGETTHRLTGRDGKEIRGATHWVPRIPPPVVEED